MSEKIVTITGGSGYVGQLQQSGLRQSGYRVDVFDQSRGPLVNICHQLTDQLGLVDVAEDEREFS